MNTTVFAEKYTSDVNARTKSKDAVNCPSYEGLQAAKSVLGSVDSRFVSFTRIGGEHKEVFEIDLANTGFILKKGVRLVLRRQVNREYEMSGECWVLELRFTKFALPRRVNVKDTVDIAEFCIETPLD